MSDFPELTQAVIDGNRNKVIEIVNAELEKGVAPQSLLSEYMIPGMLEVGNLMQEGEYFIPEVLRSAKAMKGVLEILEPLLEASGGAQSVGYIVIGTVDGIEDAGLRDRVKIMVGGAPVTQEFADEIGADGTAEDAAAAVSLAKELLAA
jgi:methanogenic corrinoid protein MtbC1